MKTASTPTYSGQIKYKKCVEFLDCRMDEVACGENQPRVLTDFTGVVLSPTGFTDGRYPPNVNCSWLIELPDTNKVKIFLYW